MNPGARGNTNADVQQWLTWASEFYGTVDLSYYEVVTNCGPRDPDRSGTRVHHPDARAGALALLLCGMLVLAMRLLNRGQRTT